MIAATNSEPPRQRPAGMWIACMLAATLGGCAVRAPRPARTSSPHGVILITIDSARRDHLSCYGYSGATTPSIDRLAASSARFEDAIASGVGTPSGLSALFTSRLPGFERPGTDDWPATWGMARFFKNPGETEFGVPSRLASLPELFRQSGFKTAGFAPNPYLFPRYGFGRGFDQYDVFQDVEWRAYPRASQVVERALRWLDQNDASQFFLFIHFMDAHAPWLATETVAAEDAHDVSRIYMSEGQPDEKRRVLQSAIDLYDAGLRAVDAAVGELVQRLVEKQLLATTLIVITSDHGEELMEHGDTFHRGTVYEELLRIPLIVHAPGHAFANLRDPARTVDLYPTIASLAGVPTPTTIDGVDLRKAERSGELYIETRRYEALRTDRYKLVVERVTGRVELYDLPSDPLEARNLRDALPSVVSRMKERLAALRMRGVGQQ